MANLYLSFLGTNDYLEAIYVFGNQKQRTRFVQVATVSFACREWSEEDRIVVFTTAEAKEKNWLDNERVGDKKGLQTCLKKLSFKPSICNVDIPYGGSEGEIWEIFNTVLHEIKENDHIVFDITHAFRSIPMLAMIILNYARVVKGIHIYRIFYGAFETLGTYEKVKKMDVEQREAPVFDLTSFDELLGWAMALDRFLNTGDARSVTSLAKARALPELRKTRGQDEVAKTTKKLSDKLEDFSNVMASCRGKRISEAANNLKEIIQEALNIETINSAIKPLLTNLQDRLSFFSNDLVRDGLQAVRWCIEHNLIQQGYTILEETIINWIAREIKIDHNNRTNREIISQAVNICFYQMPKDQWKDPACNDKEMVSKCIKILETKMPLVQTFTQITQCRNDLNHAGMVPNPMDHKGFKDRIEAFLRNIEDYISQ